MICVARLHLIVIAKFLCRYGNSYGSRLPIKALRLNRASGWISTTGNFSPLFSADIGVTRELSSSVILYDGRVDTDGRTSLTITPGWLGVVDMPIDRLRRRE